MAEKKAEKEEDEDFISKLKRMKSDTKSPSVIADTLDRLEVLENKNKDLKEKVDLLQKTEEDLKKSIEEKEDLGKQISEKDKKISNLNKKINDFSSEKASLKSKIEELEDSVKEADLTRASTMTKSLIDNLQTKLTVKKKQISDLSSKVETLESQLNKVKEGQKLPQEEVAIENSIKPEVKIKAEAGKSSSNEKGLVDDLTAELSKKKSQVLDLENKVKELTEEKESLSQQLDEMKQRNEVDVAPGLKPSKPIEKIKTTPESKTLDLLIQDLQSDLNKYKKIVEKLKKENTDLKKAQEKGGGVVDTGEIDKLNRENASLKDEIVQLEKKLMSQPTGEASSTDDDGRIEKLEEDLRERDKLIKELKASKRSEATTPEGTPMKGLIENLQNKINKLKVALKEKNKIIEELGKKEKLTFKR